MTDPSGRVEDLSPEEKRALVAELLRKELDAAVDAHPLSYGQQAMWFLYQLAPESSAYNVAFTARICSTVDTSILRRALQVVIDRHQSLRTTFSSHDGKPVQLVHRRWEASLDEVDVARVDDEALYKRVVAAYREPFDLENGPVLRTCLFTRAADDHVLLLSAHHIVLDGWATWILLDELFTSYAAETSGSSTKLPPLSVQYSDFVRWQREFVAGAAGEKMWDYWRNQLAGELPTLELPADRSRPPAQTFNGATAEFTLGDALTDAVKALARDERTTVYTVLLAAFQSLLHRYGGQQDVIVGSPMAGRSRPEFAPLVGDFINMVALRASFADAPSFRSVLSQVRETVLGALEHQDFPFPLLVNRLSSTPDSSRSPIFQVAFDLQRIQRVGELTDLLVPGKQGARAEVGGLVLEPFPMPQQEGQLDLTLQLVEAGGAFHGAIKYNSDLFDAETVERMIGHYLTLLEAAIADPESSVDALPMLTGAERQQLLDDWAGPDTGFPVHGCIHRLFEAQVTRTPDAPAVTWEGEHLSYAELNRRANRLARRIRACDVCDEMPVAIFLDRTPAMVVAILAIMKAGGVYVPLDPAYPTERLSFLLDDSGTPVVLTQEGLIDRLPAATDGAGESSVQVILVEEDVEEAGEADSNLDVPVNPENLAYIIYTSGSTGQPKGVMVTHANVVRLFSATQAWFRVDDRDVWTLFHSYAFDFSVWEMWGALLHGGRLVIVPYNVSRSPQDFYNLLASERVTILNQTPSAFRQLIRVEDVPGRAKDLALRLVIFGGEALEFQSLRPWFARHGDQHPQLMNMYGITETTVHVTYRPVTEDDLDGSVRSAIGVPIPDLRIYVLDDCGQPVPIGVPGELHVGGAGVARGYLNRPELTAERFIENPFERDSTARLYRSGDLVRYRPDGDLEYLGRIDFQVKIRGFRIELGEIESVLGQYPGIRETAVLARVDGTRDPKLVAYFSTLDGSVPSPRELRTFLKAKLPEYMVPATFVPLEALPLSNNGKVDRAALPAPSQQRADLGDDYVAPRTPTERAVASTWSDVLGVDRIGVYDNFFDLGGQSLQIVEVLAAIEESFGLRINPGLAQFQTLGQLAAICDEMVARGEVRKPKATGSTTGKVMSAMRRMLGAGPRQEM